MIFANIAPNQTTGPQWFRVESGQLVLQQSDSGAEAMLWNVRLWGETLPSDVESLVAYMEANDYRLSLLAQSSEYCEFKCFVASGELHKADLVKQVSSLKVNFAVSRQTDRFVKPELMVFDMDSTLIQMECIDEIARMCGFYDKVSAITERAMRGELDFAASLKERVALLAGLDESKFLSLTKSLPVTSGVPAVVEWAKQHDCKLAVVSGGFVPFVEALQKQLGFDFAHANQLEVVENKLTGKVEGAIVDGDAKRVYLTQLREQLGLSPQQVWAIGDGANDLLMMSEAGLGIAFHAKPAVVEQADASILQPDMAQLLQLLRDC